MEKRKKVFKDVVHYTASSFFANILNFITAIVIRSLLAPVLMGTFNHIMLFFDYGKYYHLGILHALDKELSVLYGSNDLQSLERTKNVGFTLCLIGVFTVSLSIFAASFFFAFGNQPILAYGMRFVSILLLLQAAISLYTVFNRTRNNYLTISKYVLLAGGLDLLFKIGLTLLFGLPGLLWATLLTFLCGAIYLYKATAGKFRIINQIPFYELKQLLHIGFPIFVMGFVFLVIRSIDRIMIIRLLDTEALGFYTIALMAASYTVQIPNLVSAVIFPRFYQAFGAKQDIAEIKDIFVKPNIVFAYLYPIIIGLSILLLPLLVGYLLPKYVAGLTAAKILLLGVFFLSFVQMPGYLLVVLNKQNRMIIIGSSAVLAGIILIRFFVLELRLGIAGVALATAFSYFLYGSLSIYYAFRQYTKDLSEQLKFFTELYLPFIWTIAVLYLLQGFSFKPTADFFRDLAAVTLRSTLFVIACIPLLYYVNRKTELLKLLKLSWVDFRNKGNNQNK